MAHGGGPTLTGAARRSPARRERLNKSHSALSNCNRKEIACRGPAPGCATACHAYVSKISGPCW